MSQPIRILLQTTIPTTEDDWSIARFSLLRDYLSSLKDESSQLMFSVTARDREADADGNDPVLSRLKHSDFDELWLFALDTGDGLSEKDVAGITAFHQQGKGIMATRDHQDMGISMLALSTIGHFHYFHTRNNDPDPSRCCRDDSYTAYIDWPNYHSGRNGDYQTITPIEPLHPLLTNPQPASTGIELFPAHPHEGAIGVPLGATDARVLATGKSLVTGRTFNLIVASQPSQGAGRLIVQSTFHHFVDYNWDISYGCPSFVDELPGEGMARNPQALADIKAYVRNLALWLPRKS